MFAKDRIRGILFSPLDPIKDQSIFRVRTQAVIAGLAHLPTWWVWTYLYPQPYESLTWRVANVLLGVVLLIASFMWSVHDRRLSILYFFVMTMQTTGFASWFYLANNGNTVWLASYAVLILLYIMMTDWRLALVGTLFGFGLSLAVMPFADPEVWAMVSRSSFTGDAAVVLSFAFVMGLTIQSIDIDLRDVRLQTHLKALGVAAHEIRTPIAGIGLISAALSERIEAVSDVTLKTGLQQLVREIDRNVGISHSLIRSHLINANPLSPVLNQRQLSCAEVAKDCISLFERTDHARERIATLVIHSDFKVHADRLALTQALRNLLDNAFQSLELKYGVPPMHSILIEIRHHAATNQGTIRVSDTGHGIKKSDLANIFRPFFTTNKTNGNGLGLSLVSAVVSAYKGKVTVESQVGLGTKFTIRLPAQRP